MISTYKRRSQDVFGPAALPSRKQGPPEQAVAGEAWMLALLQEILPAGSFSKI